MDSTETPSENWPKLTVTSEGNYDLEDNWLPRGELVAKEQKQTKAEIFQNRLVALSLGTIFAVLVGYSLVIRWLQ
jgi:hypothetical protein